MSSYAMINLSEDSKVFEITQWDIVMCLQDCWKTVAVTTFNKGKMVMEEVMVAAEGAEECMIAK